MSGSDTILHLVGWTRHMTDPNFSPLELNASLVADGPAGERNRLASIVHDFNNFLTPIVNILVDLQRQKAGTARQIRRIDGAIFCAYRAGILARQLIAGEEECSRHPAVTHVEEVLARLEPVLAGAIRPDIALRFETSGNLPPVQFGEDLLERALLNLVLNARDAMPAGGDLVVATSIDRPMVTDAHQTDLMVRISVSDTGVGMSKATLEHAGEPRFSTKTHGSGLGLMTVRQMLENRNGLLSIASTENFGTTVDLWLPLAQTPSIT
jgi:signal transduction histidine kinase